MQIEHTTPAFRVLFQECFQSPLGVVTESADRSSFCVGGEQGGKSHGK